MILLVMGGLLPQVEVTTVQDIKKVACDAVVAVDDNRLCASPDAFEGKWVLTGAYTAADGMLGVKTNACFLEVEDSIENNQSGTWEYTYIFSKETGTSQTASGGGLP